MANRIHAKGEAIHEEAKAGQAGLKPGMLAQMYSDTVIVANEFSQGFIGDEVLIITEDALQGQDVNGVYADGDVVSYMIPQKGTTFRGRIKDESVWAGMTIASAGNGYLTINNTPTIAVAKCLEAVDAIGDGLALMRTL
jgi:hypothetical protein